MLALLREGCTSDDIATRLGQASFSPDGKQVAYVNNDAGKTSLIIADAPRDSATRKIVRSADSSTDYIDPLAWSPDGAYLLLMTGKLGAPCVGSPDPDCHLFATMTYEVVAANGACRGNAVWALTAKPDPASPSRLMNVEWAGPRRLLVGEPSVGNAQGTPFVASATFVSIPGGEESTPASPRLADDGSLSPDGNSGMIGDKLLDVSTSKETQVVAYDASYMTDWTADSSALLLAFGGL